MLAFLFSYFQSFSVEGLILFLMWEDGNKLLKEGANKFLI
ncbi:hypothetical protein JSMCR1_p317 (plasmid) [Escherichia coli]|nr:hypothetical protein JSMCR1_p317 [Escherichia coli]